MYEVTVIIPTFREEANIGRVIREVDAVLREHAILGEILIIDDNSPDRTIAIVRELEAENPRLRHIVRNGERGLSQSVVDGFSHARSDIFLIMDADLSHPPELIPQMVAGIRAGADIVIGSRYMPGGEIKKWPVMRRILSLGATFLGRLFFPEVSDPVSGFFAVKKGVVTTAPLKPRGYKILLEILGKGIWKKETEIPFQFADRTTGSSKLRLGTVIEYICQIADIARHAICHPASVAGKEFHKLFRFGIVGLSGILVNEGVLIYLKEYAKLILPVASIIAIELSILSNFILNDLWTFGSHRQYTRSRRWQRLLAFQFVSVGGALINFMILNAFAIVAGADYRVANILGILVAFVWNFYVNRRCTWVPDRTAG
jgi:dolichol-phosphate mannosyltransferase